MKQFVKAMSTNLQLGKVFVRSAKNISLNHVFNFGLKNPKLHVHIDIIKLKTLRMQYLYTYFKQQTDSTSRGSITTTATTNRNNSNNNKYCLMQQLRKKKVNQNFLQQKMSTFAHIRKMSQEFLTLNIFLTEEDYKYCKLKSIHVGTQFFLYYIVFTLKASNKKLQNSQVYREYYQDCNTCIHISCGYEIFGKLFIVHKYIF